MEVLGFLILIFVLITVASVVKAEHMISYGKCSKDLAPVVRYCFAAAISLTIAFVLLGWLASQLG